MFILHKNNINLSISENYGKVLELRIKDFIFKQMKPLLQQVINILKKAIYMTCNEI